MSKILKGTMLLTAGTFLSKFLGMIYTIPFEQLVGTEGTDLYVFAYTPYSILLSLSSMGVPVAVSKFVSKYNSLGDYETGRRMLRAGMKLMAITGVVAFFILFFSAELMATWTLSEQAAPSMVQNTTMVIRMVSFALLIIPVMSIVRGFFQGHESMAPTAVSQVIEQIVRIGFLLIAVFIITKVVNGTIATAIGFATFAAFIGGIAACTVLYVYWRKRKPHLDRQLELQEHSYEISNFGMFKELFSYAGPFILVGIATPLYQLVDQLTFLDAMEAAGLSHLAGGALSAINLLSHKLVMIPVTLGLGLSLALLPAITKTYTNKDFVHLNKQVNQALQIIALLIIPAVVGLSVVAIEAYGTFYGTEEVAYKGNLLRWYAPVGLFFALYTVTSSILQGINRQNFAVISLGTGIVLKLSINTWFITVFGAKGAIIATGLAVATAVVLNFWRIFSAIEFSYKPLFKRTLLVSILTAIMAFTIILMKWLLGFIVNPMENRLGALFVLIISIGLGGLTYLWLAYKTTLLEHVLGGRVTVLDKFLTRSKRRSGNEN